MLKRMAYGFRADAYLFLKIRAAFPEFREEPFWEKREDMVLTDVYRITTFVPPDRLEALLNGISSVVSLQYGRYDQSAWWSEGGIEQYRPLPGANPTSGAEGQVSRVPSVRLEFIIPRDPLLLDKVVTVGLVPHHPWEEPAIFIDESSITLAQHRGSDDQP